MIGSYQEEQAIKPVEPSSASFATIGTVYSDGVTLIFDGQTVESTKRYKVNQYIAFAAGDRVKVTKDGGTYIVEYPVGDPIPAVTHVYFRYYSGHIQAKVSADGSWMNLN